MSNGCVQTRCRHRFANAMTGNRSLVHEKPGKQAQRERSPSDCSEQARSLLGKLERAAGHEAKAGIRKRLRRLASAAEGELVATLSHTNPLMRWEAVNLLGERAFPSVTTDVLEFALRERERHARWRSFWAVSRFPRSDTEPALVRAMRGCDTATRWNAALMLSMLGHEACIPVLRDGLRAEDSWMRWEALSALKAVEPAGAEEDIARCLDPSCPRHLRQEAALALGRLRSSDAVRYLVRALADDEAEVRWRASLGLSRFGRDGARVLKARLKIERHQKVISQLRSDLRRIERES